MSEAQIKRARELRKAMSPPELALWLRLKELRPRGHHFRRQAPEGVYTFDFVCRRAKLVIEVDGAQHFEDEAARRDERRDALLHASGFRVLRFTAHEVGFELDGVWREILQALGEDSDLVLSSEAPKPVARGRRHHLTRMGLKRKP